MSARLIFIISTFTYYYPIIFFNELKWFSPYGISNVEINLGARLCVLVAVFAMLILSFSLGLKKTSANWLPQDRYVDYCGLPHHVAVVCFFFSTIVLLVLIKNNGFGLGEHTKSELYSQIGYEFKLIQSFSIVGFASSIISRNKYLIIFSFIFPLILISFGVRELIATYLVILMLTSNISKIKRNLTLFFLVGTFLVFVKVFGYGFYPAEVINAYINNSDQISDGLMLINPESVGSSAILNLIVLTNFKVTNNYFIDLFISMIPFVKTLGYNPVGFDYYLANTISTPDYYTFSPGLFPIAFATLGGLGVVLSSVLLLVLIGWLDRVGRLTRYFFLKLLLLSVLGSIALLIHRHELIYFVSVIRGILGAATISYLISLLLKGASTSHG